MSYRLINWLILIICIVLFINLIRSFFHLQKQGKIIKGVEEKLREVTAEQDDLKRQLARSKSHQFIEKQAREKLNLGKEGEVIIILPSISLYLEPTPMPIDTSSNWEKWLKVFIYNR